MRFLLLEATFTPSQIRNSMPSLLHCSRNEKFNIVLFTQKGSKEFIQEYIGFFQEIVEFENWYTTGLIEFEALKRHGITPFDQVLAFREFDIIRAARIREKLSLSGQSISSSILFRDKFLMKLKCKESNLLTPKFNKIENPMDLITFQKQTNYPFIIKPRREANDIGLVTVKNEYDLKDFLSCSFGKNGNDLVENFIAEEFMDCELYHVDGLCLNGTIICSTAGIYTGIRKQYGLKWKEQNDDSFYGSNMLDHDSQITSELVDFTSKLIKSFDPNGTFPFHAELWRDDEGKIFLNEIASRSGGYYVYFQQKAVYNIHPESLMFRFFCDKTFDLLSAVPSKPGYVSASSRIPPKAGKVKKVPDLYEISSVYYYECTKKVNDFVEPKKNWNDGMGLLVTRGKNASEAQDELRKALDFFRMNFLTE